MYYIMSLLQNTLQKAYTIERREEVNVICVHVLCRQKGIQSVDFVSTPIISFIY